MTLRLLGQTMLESYCMLQLGGRVVQQRHDEVVRLIGQLGLKDRLLFAEPVVTWPSEGRVGKIVWYADTEREPVGLETLRAERYKHSADSLRQVLAVVTGSGLQAKQAALLRAACVIARLEGVLVDGERIVLSEWGVMGAPSSNGLDTQIPPLACTPLAPFLPVIAPAGGAVPAEPPPPTAPSPDVKAAHPDLVPVSEKAPDVVKMLAPATARASDPAFPMASSFSLTSQAAQQPEPCRPKRELVWHAVTAIVFLLLGLAAGLRLMAPARLALLLGL